MSRVLPGVLRSLIKKPSAMAADQRGASMVEFAIIALPFFILIFGTIEVAIVAWANYELENATEDAARLIRTGQVNAGGENAIRTAICDRSQIMGNCDTKLRLNVQSFNSFNGVTQPNPLDSDGNLRSSGFAFDPGLGGNVVLVTAYYEWPLLNFTSSLGIGNLGNGNRLLQASAVFRNEPFPATEGSSL